MKKDGQFGKLKQLPIRPYDISRSVAAEDAEILNLLLGYHDVESQSPYYYGFASSRVTEAVLPKSMQQFLLPKLAATQRLARAEKEVYQQPEFTDLRPLAWDEGPPWRFRLDIRADDARKCWTLSGQFYRSGSEETLPVQAARMIFKQGLMLLDDRIGPLETGGSARMIEALRKTPQVEVPYADRWELLRRLWQLPNSPEMNVPDNLRTEEVQVPPQGHLIIDKPERYDPYRLPGRVEFLYDGKAVAAQDGSRGIVDEEKGRVLVRDRQRERELAGSLAAQGIRPMEGWQAEKYSIWVPSQKLPEAVEALVAQSWLVEAQGYHVRRAGTWQMNVTSGVDWFDLEGTLDFDGMEVHLPEILAALRHGQNYVRLKDGTRGILPQQWLARLASMVELGEAEGDAIRFRSSQALLLDALLAAQEQVTVDAPFMQLREKLRSFNGIGAIGEPQGFTGELRAYQKIGLGWLQFLQDFRLGGCLADDMGLGKTVQVLALLQQRRLRPVDNGGRRAPSLVVVPRSLVFNWVEEAKRFTPELRVLDYTGLQRASLLDSFEQHDMVIATYGTMQRDIVKLKDIRFDYAILDESQAIKNAHSQRAKACRLLKADHRLAMTGTPVENHLGELWSLLEFLNPRMLGTASVFQDISKKVSEDNEELSLLRRAGPLHSSPHQAAGSDRVAAEERADTLLRPGGPAAQALRRVADLLPRRAGRTDRQDGHGQGQDPRAGGAAPLAAGGHPPGAGRQGGRGRIQRQARRAHGAASRDHRRRAQGPGLLAVHVVPGDRPQSARSGENRLRISRRPHAAAAAARRTLPGGREVPLVPHQPQGRRARAEPHGGRLRVHPRSLVESGRRGPGHRPRPPHRPAAARLRLSPHRPRHGRGEDRRVAEDEARSGRGDYFGRRQRAQPADLRGPGVAAELNVIHRPSASTGSAHSSARKAMLARRRAGARRRAVCRCMPIPWRQTRKIPRGP